MANRFDLQDRIKSVRLTKTENQVAAYFAKHATELPFKTTQDIALELGISDTSVIRTCRSLGYKGYTELQEEQRSSLKAYMESSRYTIPSKQVASKYEKYKAGDTSTFLEMALNNLTTVCANNRQEVFRKAAELIYSSEHVFIAGFRGMAGQAQALGVYLHQYLPFVDSMSVCDTSCVEKMLDYGENDCVILLSVERYSKMSCTIAEMARENKSRLIVIVDKITAPVAYQADVVLVSEFSSPLPVNSFIATQFIIENLLYEVSKIKGVAQEDRLQRLNTNLEKLDLY